MTPPPTATTPPAELGIDLMSGTFFGGDPFPAFAWMREHAPVFYDEPNDLWAVARYRDVKAASTDTETFSNAGGIRPKFPPLPMMIDFDAPEHVRRRRLVSSGFTPRRVREMEDHVRAHLRPGHRPGLPSRALRLRPRHRRPAPAGGDRRHAGRRPRSRGRPAALVRGDAELARGAPTPRPSRRGPGLHRVHGLHRAGAGGPPGDRAATTTWSGCWSTGDRRGPARPRLPDPRDPADPGGRGRDHPARDHRGHARPPAPPRPAGACSAGTRPSCPPRWRRCCAG